MTDGTDSPTFDTCRREGETYTMGVGRARERADVLDFIRHPPGSLPPHVRGSMTELANAIAAGRHSGDGERLYEDLPWLRDRADECTAEMARLREQLEDARTRQRAAEAQAEHFKAEAVFHERRAKRAEERAARAEDREPVIRHEGWARLGEWLIAKRAREDGPETGHDDGDTFPRLFAVLSKLGVLATPDQLATIALAAGEDTSENYHRKLDRTEPLPASTGEIIFADTPEPEGDTEP